MTATPAPSTIWNGFILALLLTGSFAPAAAQTSDREPTRWYPILDPASMYTPSSGIGIGGGVYGRSVFRNGDAVRFRVQTSQFRQYAHAGWASARPATPVTALVLHARAGRALHEGYYGSGPGSDGLAKQWLHHDRMLAGARVFRPVRTRGWIQLGVWGEAHAIRSAEQKGSRPLPPSDGLDQWVGSGLRGSVSTAVDAGWTGTDGPFRLGTMVQAYVRPRVASFRQLTAGLTVFHARPLGRVAVYSGLQADWTLASDGDVPYYSLPQLDSDLAPGFTRHRFYGRDRLLLNAGVMMPVLQILQSHRIQLVASAHAGQVYDAMRRQFVPSIAWNPAGPRERWPLVGSVSVALEVIGLRASESLIGIAIGLSSDGLTSADLTLRHDLRRWQNPIR